MNDAVAGQFREIKQLIIGDPDLTRIWTRGIENPDSLDSDERMRLVHLVFLMFQAFCTSSIAPERSMRVSGKAGRFS